MSLCLGTAEGTTLWESSRRQRGRTSDKWGRASGRLRNQPRPGLLEGPSCQASRRWGHQPARRGTQNPEPSRQMRGPKRSQHRLGSQGCSFGVWQVGEWPGAWCRQGPAGRKPPREAGAPTWGCTSPFLGFRWWEVSPGRFLCFMGWGEKREEVTPFRSCSQAPPADSGLGRDQDQAWSEQAVKHPAAQPVTPPPPPGSLPCVSHDGAHRDAAAGACHAGAPSVPNGLGACSWGRRNHGTFCTLNVQH